MSRVAADKKAHHRGRRRRAGADQRAVRTPYTLNYACDTVALARGTGDAVVKAGGKTWYFLTADHAFGAALQADTTSVVGRRRQGAGLGQASAVVQRLLSFLLQAQSSKAEILALANAGADATNAIKAANEFGLTRP